MGWALRWANMGFNIHQRGRGWCRSPSAPTHCLLQLPGQGAGGSHHTGKGDPEGTVNEQMVSRWRKLRGAFNHPLSPKWSRGSSPSAC